MFNYEAINYKNISYTMLTCAVCTYTLFKCLTKVQRLFSVIAFCALSSMATHTIAQESEAGAASNPSQTLRDPTTPLGHRAVVQGVSSAEYNLNSVLISPRRKQAVINGVMLREGQAIPGSGGVVVKHISPQTVVLQQGAKTWSLRLAPSVVIRH